MINNDLPPNDGSISSIQKPNASNNKMARLTGLALVGFLYLGGLGLLCVWNGGYVGVQWDKAILTFSGQSKGK